MRRTDVLQGIRLMKFEEIFERTRSRELSQEEAGLVLGVSERTFRRWRERFEAEGAEGLYDRRLGRVSAHRVPVDTVMQVLDLFDTRYRGFTTKHFWDKLVYDHDFEHSYNWVRLTLQAHGCTHKAPRRGAHRRKRPRRPLPGMMLLEARLQPRMGAGAMVGPDRHHGRRHVRDHLGLLRPGGRLHELLPGALRGDLGQGPVLRALCRSGLALLAHARGRRQGGQGQPHPGGPGAQPARYRVDPGLLAAGPGTLRAHVRHPAETRWTCPGLVESLLLTPGQPSRTGPGSGSRASSAGGSDCRTRRCI